MNAPSKVNGSAHAPTPSISEPDRFCKDCLWWEPFDANRPHDFQLSKCTHPVVHRFWSQISGGRRLELVSGRRMPSAFAQNERGSSGGKCGEAGRLFEPHPAPVVEPRRVSRAWLALLLLAVIAATAAVLIYYRGAL